MKKREAVIVSGARTAIGAFGGGLKDVRLVDLGSLVIRESIRRAGIRPKASAIALECCPNALKGDGPSELDRKYCQWDKSLREVEIDEVIMGNVLQAGQGQNPGRQASIYGGVPKETPAFTINKLCASGLKSITLAAQSIEVGENDVVVAGGMESMSTVPYGLPKARWGYRLDTNAKADMYDLMVLDGLWESFYGYHMGNTAENIAAKYGISREEQDKIGLLSHQRALAAIKEGRFKDEIVPVLIPQKKGEPTAFAIDERPMETSLEKMAKLAPSFRKEGTVTAGNASGLNDAAAAVVIMSREKATELGLKPFAIIKAYASGGVDPAYMGLGPIPAVRKVLRKAGLSMKDLDMIDLNEAFAAQVIGCMRDLDITPEQTNLHGSGISLGHPIGATGARMVVTAIYEMQRSNFRHGLVSMCIGGGQGMAMVLER
ncbi:MAG: acetyl-CoA C-acetyltransferase [Chloroflexi bacterium]|nr:acetyl-CoA C-acetyltransferase [Chloroflexota bacterium]